MTAVTTERAGKVAEVTLAFWVLKIAATTLGETGGDAVSMSLGLGYIVATAIFAVIFLVLVTAQVRARRFHPFLYWAVIVGTTTVGTTMADFADRSLGIGYPGGSAILAGLLGLSLFAWWRTTGSISVSRIDTPVQESFYWATILFSNTLGTALGDFLADDGGLGYLGGAAAFAAAIAVVVALWRFTRVSPAGLFWAAFILTRPLGATVGDFLDKPIADGGLALSRITASAVLAAFMVAAILVTRPRAGAHGAG